MRTHPTRPTVRLPAALAAALEARVGAGGSVSDVVRQALEAWLGVEPTAAAPMSDTREALSDVHARLATLAQGQQAQAAEVAFWVPDLQTRLAQVEQDVHARLARLEGETRDEGRRGEQTRRGDAATGADPALAVSPCPRVAGSKAGEGDAGHAYGDTGQTLRRRDNGVCPECYNARRRAARRTGARGLEEAP